MCTASPPFLVISSRQTRPSFISFASHQGFPSLFVFFGILYDDVFVCHSFSHLWLVLVFCSSPFSLLLLYIFRCLLVLSLTHCQAISCIHFPPLVMPSFSSSLPFFFGFARSPVLFRCMGLLIVCECGFQDIVCAPLSFPPFVCLCDLASLLRFLYITGESITLFYSATSTSPSPLTTWLLALAGEKQRTKYRRRVLPCPLSLWCLCVFACALCVYLTLFFIFQLISLFVSHCRVFLLVV